MQGSHPYCYVDETGQDTEGALFIVSVIVPGDRDAILEYLSDLEIKSGKGKFKWGRAHPTKRLHYLQTILTQKSHPLKIYYAKYIQSKEYKYTTILTVAKAIRSIPQHPDTRFIIYVDGLSKKDQQYYGSELHHLGIASKKVRGVKRDENNALIRLADSVCGFLRDLVEEERGDERALYAKAIRTGILTEV